MATMGNACFEESELFEEVELLKEIYINELELKMNDGGDFVECIRLLLHPATGAAVDEQWVCLTMELDLTPQYPDVPPKITIKNPRGLAEDHVTRLMLKLEELAEESKGMPMLFGIIEAAKDSLTTGNVPHGPCMICLEVFNEGEPFTRSQCYHYFHCHCLLRYIHHSLADIEEEHDEQRKQAPHMHKKKKQVVCPVCRDMLTYDLQQLKESPQPSVQSFQYKPDLRMRQLQKQMSKLFNKQKIQGGIIDVEAEKNKYLVSLSKKNKADAGVRQELAASNMCFQSPPFSSREEPHETSKTNKSASHRFPRMKPDFSASVKNNERDVNLHEHKAKSFGERKYEMDNSSRITGEKQRGVASSRTSETPRDTHRGFQGSDKYEESQGSWSGYRPGRGRGRGRGRGTQRNAESVGKIQTNYDKSHVSEGNGVIGSRNQANKPEEGPSVCLDKGLNASTSRNQHSEHDQRNHRAPRGRSHNRYPRGRHDHGTRLQGSQSRPNQENNSISEKHHTSTPISREEIYVDRDKKPTRNGQSSAKNELCSSSTKQLSVSNYLAAAPPDDVARSQPSHSQSDNANPANNKVKVDGESNHRNCSRQPPGFKMCGPPPGFSEKQMPTKPAPPPGFSSSR